MGTFPATTANLDNFNETSVHFPWEKLLFLLGCEDIFHLCLWQQKHWTDKNNVFAKYMLADSAYIYYGNWTIHVA